MTEYRRLRLPGATYFFTVCLEQRGSPVLVDHIDALRFAYAVTIREFPVTCHAMVILPDHLHAIWTEPDDTVQFSERWRRIKARFSHGLPVAARQRPSVLAKRERGIWQRRFWDHAIRDEADFAAAMDYCWNNPVKHGLVEDPAQWRYSSFVKRVEGKQQGGDGQIAHQKEAGIAQQRDGRIAQRKDGQIAHPTELH